VSIPWAGNAPAPDVGGLLSLPVVGDLARAALVLVGSLALVGLGVALIVAGLLSLLGFKPGDVARLSPPGRAATVAEIAVGGSR
jgi:hypothetical protein